MGLSHCCGLRAQAWGAWGAWGAVSGRGNVRGVGFLKLEGWGLGLA